MRLTLLLLAALVVQCSDEKDCSDLTCSCSTAADCDSGWACAAGDGENVCYPPGKFPIQVLCSGDSDCDASKNLICQEGLHRCLQKCSNQNTACPERSLCQGGSCLPYNSLPQLSTCNDSRLCAEGECLHNSC